MMEIITGIERRRQWPVERKLAVLEEAASSSDSAAAIARRHDICPQQLYRWRREWREGRLDGPAPAARADHSDGMVELKSKED